MQCTIFCFTYMVLTYLENTRKRYLVCAQRGEGQLGITNINTISLCIMPDTSRNILLHDFVKSQSRKTFHIKF